LLDKAKELGFDVDKENDLTPKGLEMFIICALSPDDKTRADSDDGYRAGVFSTLMRGWSDRVSKSQTNRSIEYYKNHQPVAVNNDGYQDYGN
jgi:hypothetical protein